MLDALITTSIATGASLLTSGATWLFARKKYVSEVKSNDIENMRSTLRFYIDLVEDNKRRMDLYQEELTKANDKILLLTEEIYKLKTEQSSLRAENEELKAKLNNREL